MQVWLNYLLMVALAVMVGVSVSVNQSSLEKARIQSYIEANPGFSQAVTDALYEGTLLEGMGPEQVLFSWGKPASVKVIEGYPELELWSYPKSMVLFENTEVKDWRTTRSKYDSGDDLIRRLVYLMAKDQLPERTATLIRKGQIAEGMTQEQVQASWGEPVDVLPIYNENLGEFTVWVFERGRNGRTNVTFQEGQVVAWAEVPLVKLPADDAP